MHDTYPSSISAWPRFFSPASFDIPRFVASSAWITHAPFGSWIVGALKPRVIVELGLDDGLSYFVFCQAVRSQGLSTVSFAIDDRPGGTEVRADADQPTPDLEAYNRTNYADFSQLVRSNSADAVTLFGDGSIDLLHLRGGMTMENASREFGTWRPKLSDQAVVLIHGTQDHGSKAGPLPIWNELRSHHPRFEFRHGHGLGVVGFGTRQVAAIDALFSRDEYEDSRDFIRLGYGRLGAAIEDHRRAALAASEAERRLRAEESLAHATAQANATRFALEAHLAATTGAQSVAAAARALAEADGLLASVGTRLRRASRRLVRLTRAGALPPAVPRPDRKSGPPLQPSAPTLPSQPAKPSRPALKPVEGLVSAAVEVVKREGWLASRPLWQAVHDQRVVVVVSNFHTAQPTAIPDFEEVDPYPIDAKTVRWCVYTTLFGDYDDLRTPLDRSPDVDFICFSDRDVAVDGWRTIRVDARMGPIRDSRRYKLLPHEELPDYDASLYFDANILLTGDIRRFVHRWCVGRPWVMWRHTQRCDVVDEAISVLAQSKAEPELVLRQMTDYEAAGLPRSTGLVEASFIWREHGHEPTRRLMDDWHGELSRYCARDQISLGFLMWRTGTRPKVLPAHLGNVRHNCVASSVPHYSQMPKRILARPPTPRGPAQAKRKLAFVYSDAFRTSGSTTMRGFQLAQIVKTHLGERFEVDVTANTGVTDSIVVLSKGMLSRVTEYEMLSLARNNVAIVADFVDDPVRTSLLEFIDLLWAASIGFLRAALSSRPLVDVDLVTHHVDVRIPQQDPPPNFAAAYFGEPINAVLGPAIERLVTVVPVNTKIDDGRWLGDLGRYSLHYAVRPATKPSTYKPFLKGFTAARCGANIIVDRNDGDAVHYLGDDYPYLLSDAQPAAILAGIEYARQSFGSAEWSRALEIMRHVEALSTPERVALDVQRSLRRFE